MTKIASVAANATASAIPAAVASVRPGATLNRLLSQ